MMTHQPSTKPDLYELRNIRAVDGDTLDAEVVQSFGACTRLRIRLKGWWAPEPTGRHSACGLRAKALLQAFVDSRSVFLHSPSCRQDRFGRTVGSLWHQGRIVFAEQVLGGLQMTEEDHKRERDIELRLVRVVHTNGVSPAEMAAYPDTKWAGMQREEGR